MIYDPYAHISYMIFFPYDMFGHNHQTFFRLNELEITIIWSLRLLIQPLLDRSTRIYSVWR